MSNIVLARIDDRLIHGQVMTAWVQYTGGNEIVIADDEVAKDPFLSAVITGAVPKRLKAEAMTVENAADYLKREQNNENKKFIVLAKGPKTYESLIRQGVEIREINLGGMGSKSGRSKLYKNISASDEEREVFCRLMKEKVHVYIQVVPNMETAELGKML